MHGALVQHSGLQHIKCVWARGRQGFAEAGSQRAGVRPVVHGALVQHGGLQHSKRVEARGKKSITETLLLVHCARMRTVVWVSGMIGPWCGPTEAFSSKVKRRVHGHESGQHR